MTAEKRPLPAKGKGEVKPFVYRSGLISPMWYCLHKNELKHHSKDWAQVLFFANSIALLYKEEIERAAREAL